MLGKPKIRTVLVLALLLLLSVFLIIWLTEKPVFLFSKHPETKYAAIAIRDHVSSFEKFGTRLFTWPDLARSYHEVIYLTEYSRHEKQNEFVKGLDELLTTHEHVDVFLLAHANEYYRWVLQIDSTKRKKIRMVYNTGCSGASQKDIWLDLGAQSYVGHTSGESISPVFYFYFLRRWCAGERLSEAVVHANNLMINQLGRMHIPIDPLVLWGSQGVVFGPADYKIQGE
jgi:hypothetical protein